MEANLVNKKIDTYNQLKINEIKAITKSRIVVINQSLDCPIKNSEELKQMEKDRNITLIDVIAYGSGLNSKEDEKVREILKKIINKIYDIKLNDICTLNINSFDEKMLKYEIDLNHIFNQEIQKQSKRLSCG